jgi:hypothetical protein
MQMPKRERGESLRLLLATTRWHCLTMASSSGSKSQWCEKMRGGSCRGIGRGVCPSPPGALLLCTLLLRLLLLQVMPRIAPITKIQNCKDLNATVVIQGAHIAGAVLCRGKGRNARACVCEKGRGGFVFSLSPPPSCAESREIALEIGQREGLAYVHGFDDPHGEPQTRREMRVNRMRQCGLDSACWCFALRSSFAQ